MKLKSLLKEVFEEQIAESALKKLKAIILSSSSDVSFNQQEIDFLKQTVSSSNLPLFRGLGLISQRVSDEDRKAINKIREGDQSPSFLNNSFHKHNVASFTKSKSVAKYYSEGEVAIIIEVDLASNAIICDLTNLEKLLKKNPNIKHNFDDDDFRYMKREKEVIVDSSKVIDSKVVYKKGWFRF